MKRIIMSAVLALFSMGALATAAQATEVGPEADSWYVCKYVGPPGSDEVLQSGGNPIFVNSAAILAETAKDVVAIGDTFSDAQTHSVVVAGPFAPPGTDPEPTCPVTRPNPPPPPPPTTPPTTPTTPPATCQSEASVSLGPWHGDPLITIRLTGPGTFAIKGGVLRRTGIHIVRRTLACGETAVIRRYHVMPGHQIRVWLNGEMVASKLAPYRVSG